MAAPLYSSKNFGVITFATTSQALKAEKVLTNQGWENGETRFAIIPTPREISASCGLAVKVLPGDLEAVTEVLRSGGVQLSGVYHLDKTGGEPRLEELNI